MEYSFLQIVLFFFIYCFIGWIWETMYVSVVKRRFENRGFLHGPFIPIYGFGAMTILFSTMQVRNNLLLVFIAGMVGASVLELVTGLIMEALFHVRYWDYSKLPLNFRGYVSLPVSIVWGLFSVLMVSFIHTPVEGLVLSLSRTKTEVVTVLLTMVGSMDLALSLREAFDLKEIMQHISELEVVQREMHRVDMLVALIDNDTRIIKEKVEERLIAIGKGPYKRIKRLIERNPNAISNRYRLLLEEIKLNIQNIRNNKK